MDVVGGKGTALAALLDWRTLVFAQDQEALHHGLDLMYTLASQSALVVSLHVCHLLVWQSRPPCKIRHPTTVALHALVPSLFSTASAYMST